MSKPGACIVLACLLVSIGIDSRAGDIPRKMRATVLPLADPVPTIRLRMSDGRGYAEITEQPTQENDFTTTIVLRDEREGGGGFNSSDWMEFRVYWKD